MDTRTGEIYPNLKEALKAGVPERDLVEVKGPAEAISRLQRAARSQGKRAAARQRSAKKRQQKASRKRNRR
jgi:hypothetical protein